MLALIPFTVTSTASVLPLVQLSFISAIASFNYAPIHNTHYFFLHDASVPKGPGPPRFQGFTITLRHTSVGRAPLEE